jgi:hypothetical protein
MMNERIKGLLVQSGVKDNWNDADWYSMSPDMVEKFAELIVQECMNLVTYVGHSTRGFDCCGHVRFTNEKIKEHFGVEE